MNLLLDTQALIAMGQDTLPKLAKNAVTKASVVYFSTASVWEIAIKSSLGKIKFNHTATEYSSLLQGNGLLMLNIEVEHIEKLRVLPQIHKDPFDRMIASQALIENLRLVTSDAVFEKYSVKYIWD